MANSNPSPPPVPVAGSTPASPFLEFSGHLYPGDLPEEQHLVVFTLPDGVSAFFTDLDEAARHVAGLPKGVDAYFGIGLQEKDLGSKKRGGANTVASIPGFFADVDVGEKDAGRLYPPTKEAALELIAKLPAKPTLIVDSGSGFHCYWLFKEPWVFDTDAEREEAARYLKAWSHGLRDFWKVNGAWDIDYSAAGDMARVLRVPGTLNCRWDAPVVLHTKGGPTWPGALDLLEAAGFPTAVVGGATGDATPGVTVTLPADLKGLEVPSEKLARLLTNEKAGLTYFGKRVDLGKDLSRSAQALANYTVHAGWEDAETAALLLDFYARMGDPDLQHHPKPHDWLKRTIEKAHNGTGPKSTQLVEKEAILTRLQAFWNCPDLTGTVKQGMSLNEFEYALLLRDRAEMWLGNELDILKGQRAIQAKIWAATSIIPNILTLVEWKKVCQDISDLAEVRFQDTRDVTAMREWIWTILQRLSLTSPIGIKGKHALAFQNINLADVRQKAWVCFSQPITTPLAMFTTTKGALYIYVPAFQHELEAQLNQKLNWKELVKLLGKLGFKSVGLEVRISETNREQIKEYLEAVRYLNDAIWEDGRRWTRRFFVSEDGYIEQLERGVDKSSTGDVE